jgi:hypothetical protein
MPDAVGGLRVFEEAKALAFLPAGLAVGVVAIGGGQDFGIN